MIRTSLIAATLLLATACGAAERMVMAPAPAEDALLKAGPVETAVFAGGCFWGMEGVFERLKGVVSVRSGYAGGSKASASYNMVSAGVTDHAEAVEIRYDPARISYGTLLRILFSVAHDPTQLNRQGPDKGRQYRSAIFPQSPEQARLARAYIAQLNAANTWGKPIVTTVETAQPFFVAEAYHQNYLRAHPNQPYILFNDIPKVEGLKRMFPKLWSETPAA
jgi:peptide-methionine (S)-S-oxide reductase